MLVSGGGGGIKSLQTVDGSITGSQTTYVDVPISPVNPAQSIVIVSSRSEPGSAIGITLVRGVILDSNTLRVFRGLGSSNATQFTAQIIEFDNSYEVISLSQSVVASANISIGRTIDPTKTLLFGSVSCNSTSQFIEHGAFRFQFASSNTQVRVERASSSGTATVQIYLVIIP